MTFNSLVEDQVNLHLAQATDPFAPQAVAQAPQGLGMVPIVIEQSGRGERAYDIYSRLLFGGRITLGMVVAVVVLVSPLV